MSNPTESSVTTAEAIQAVADRGKFVWVVFGVYSDRSGSKLFGIYQDQWAADDRVKMLKSAECAYSVNYAKVALDRADGVRLEP